MSESPRPLRLADLPAETIAKLKTYRYDRIIEKHEGPDKWHHLSALRWRLPPREHPLPPYSVPRAIRSLRNPAAASPGDGEGPAAFPSGREANREGVSEAEACPG